LRARNAGPRATATYDNKSSNRGWGDRSQIFTSRKDADGKCHAGDLRSLSKFAPKDWYEATNVCAAEGKVLCGFDTPCSRSGCSYDHHYQWTGEECKAGDEGLPAACA